MQARPLAVSRSVAGTGGHLIVQGLGAPLVTGEAVIGEACYLLRNLPGAPEAVLANVASGAFLLPFLLDGNAAEVAALGPG